MIALNINLLIAVTACIVVIGSVITVLLYRHHMEKTFNNLNNMLDNVLEDTFREEFFDESRLSALECKLAHYLLAERVSAENIAAERNKIKEFITDISHQTKTPISNILLYGELLKESNLDEESMKSVEAMTGQAQKLNFLITSLVKLSRLETGMITVRPEKQNVWTLTQTIYNQYKPIAEQKGLYIKLDCPYNNTEQNFYMAGYDEKWTLEAVGNIVDNAVKYTESGGITISVKRFEMFCCIEISDTGIGIAEEEQAQIFSRFYRSQSVSWKPGIGIGLYLAREIIEAENGYIKLQSKLGKGSAFGIYLARH
ncbi:MAG: HAMP domain-containing histidine kinase [Lachnospiraceae bacterium]|nr:HAMP domain-containing histidine kinase [Lachnospiraceae bacterium]